MRSRSRLPVRPERISKGQKRQVGFRASCAVLVERIALIRVWPYTLFSVFGALAAIMVLLGATDHAADLNTQIARIMRGRFGTAVMIDVASGRVVAAYHPEVAAVGTTWIGIQTVHTAGAITVRQVAFHRFAGLPRQPPGWRILQLNDHANNWDKSNRKNENVSERIQIPCAILY